MNNLNLSKRNSSIPNNAKKLRKEGKIPGIVYGGKLKEFMFEVGEIELCREIAKNGEHGILNYNINGENYKGLIKDVQRDPVSHKIIHLDLEELNNDKKIISNIPIQFEGEEYLNKNGMVLQKEKDSIKVECSADNLPKYIKFNISGSNNGTVYRIEDIEIASELSVIDDLNSVIASVSYERMVVNNDDKVKEEE
ncbi:MAG: 50S ribosomal protein L25 [Clostridium sp.]|nr:50S ribosomal protein L25 [Clostridium sp.]